MQDKFVRQIQRRNLREYAAAGIVLAGFGWGLWHAKSWLAGLGHAMIIAATLYVVLHLWRHGTARAVAPDAPAQECRQYHRQELERQRSLLRGVWRWYLAPFVPGLLVLNVARITEQLERGQSLLPVMVGIAATALVFVIVGLVNRRGVAKLDERIHALDTAEA